MAKRARPLLRRAVGLAASGAILAFAGLVAVWTRQPWLAPSLASAVFVQTLTPHEQSARPWPTAVGQLAGVAGGLAGVSLAAAAGAPSFIDHHLLLPARVAATFIAVIVTGALQLGLRAISPAGGATALIVSLGIESATWPGVSRLVLAILAATALGECARRFILKLK